MRNNRFIDVEAAVDGDSDVEDEEDDDEEEHDFVTDESDGNQNIPSSSSVRLTGIDNSQDCVGWNDLVTTLEDRYTLKTGGSGTTRTPSASKATESDEHPLQNHPAIASAIASLPTRNDYPFWRVRCKPGLEKQIVSVLLRKVKGKHQVRSAMAHHTIPSWVYLEATMNPALRNFLKLIPGIISASTGLSTEHITITDMKKLLTMESVSTMLPEVGTWVRVKRGTYKGDVGFVVDVVTEDFDVRLLLVPRFSPPRQEYESEGIHTRSMPKLFDYSSVKQQYDVDPIHRVSDDVFIFRGDRFDHGLIEKTYVSSLLSTDVSCMPWTTLCRFQESRHPKVVASESTLPRPLEWEFAEGDEVFILGSSNGLVSSPYKSGLISTLGKKEVELVSKEGVVKAKWMDVRKVMRQGDFVEITGGPHKGQKGWVVMKQRLWADTTVTIFDHDQDRTSLVCGTISYIICTDTNKHLESEKPEVEVHVNLLKRIDVPHVLGVPSRQEGNIAALYEIAPWINTEVIIVGRHASRLHRGIVKDVLHGQNTRSGLKIVMQPNIIDPTSPSILSLDYDMVVEARSGAKLHQTAPARSILFQPHNFEASNRMVLMQPPQIETPFPAFSESGNMTPFPEEPSGSTSPAWNPKSSFADHLNQLNNLNTGPLTRTPLETIAHPGPSSTPLETIARHVLLDRRLLNIPLRVTVSASEGGPKEELTVHVQTHEHQLVIRRQCRKKWEPVPLTCNPKHPSATRNNGLLVVIKGDHCGKYVRRIHHRLDNKAIVVLAVVNRVPGQMDQLTGEKIETEVSNLCVCDEPIVDKDRNELLMTALRDEARLEARLTRPK